LPTEALLLAIALMSLSVSIIGACFATLILLGVLRLVIASSILVVLTNIGRVAVLLMMTAVVRHVDGTQVH
jgi:hypothetical protein